jgi:hypothetical protein
VKIFIETSSTEFSLPNFSGVNDTAEINVTPLKSQTDFTKLLSYITFLSLKGKSSKNISMANIPILYK